MGSAGPGWALLVEGISELQERPRAGVTVTQQAVYELLGCLGRICEFEEAERAHPNDPIRSRGPMPRARCPRDPHEMRFEGHGGRRTEHRHRDARPCSCQKGPLRRDAGTLRKSSRQSLSLRVASGRAGGVVNSSTGIGQPCLHGKLHQQAPHKLLHQIPRTPAPANWRPVIGAGGVGSVGWANCCRTCMRKSHLDFWVRCLEEPGAWLAWQSAGVAAGIR